MLTTEAHDDKLNEFFFLPKKEAEFIITKKTNGEGIIKNEIVIKCEFIFELKVPEMLETLLNV